VGNLVFENSVLRDVEKVLEYPGDPVRRDWEKVLG